MTVPPGFTEETWAAAERFCDLVDWYINEGFDLDEAQAKAKEAMRVENASRRGVPP